MSLTSRLKRTFSYPQPEGNLLTLAEDAARVRALGKVPQGWRGITQHNYENSRTIDQLSGTQRERRVFVIGDETYYAEKMT